MHNHICECGALAVESCDCPFPMDELRCDACGGGEPVVEDADESDLG